MIDSRNLELITFWAYRCWNEKVYLSKKDVEGMLDFMHLLPISKDWAMRDNKELKELCIKYRLYDEKAYNLGAYLYDNKMLQEKHLKLLEKFNDFHSDQRLYFSILFKKYANDSRRIRQFLSLEKKPLLLGTIGSMAICENNEKMLKYIEYLKEDYKEDRKSVV